MVPEKRIVSVVAITSSVDPASRMNGLLVILRRVARPFPGCASCPGTSATVSGHASSRRATSCWVHPHAAFRAIGRRQRGNRQVPDCCISYSAFNWDHFVRRGRVVRTDRPTSQGAVNAFLCSVHGGCGFPADISAALIVVNEEGS